MWRILPEHSMTAPRLTRTPALLTLLLQMECEIGGITSVLLRKRKNLSGTNIDLTAPTKSSQKRTLLSAGDWEENTSAGKVKDPSLNAWWNSGCHILCTGPFLICSFHLCVMEIWTSMHPRLFSRAKFISDAYNMFSDINLSFMYINFESYSLFLIA